MAPTMMAQNCPVLIWAPTMMAQSWLVLVLGPQGEVLPPAVLEKTAQQPAVKSIPQQLAAKLTPQQLAAKLTRQQLACMMTGLGHGMLCLLLPARMNLRAATWPVLVPALRPLSIAASLGDDVAHSRHPPTNAKMALQAVAVLMACCGFARTLMLPKATVQWP
jgi:hypothetical protein